MLNGSNKTVIKAITVLYKTMHMLYSIMDTIYVIYITAMHVVMYITSPNKHSSSMRMGHLLFTVYV